MGEPLGKHLVVLVTAASPEEAERLGRILVEEKLAACVNVIRDIRSFFWWQGRVSDEQESLLVIKTRGEVFPTLRDRVKTLHSYTVPEIIALPLSDGSAEYLAWVDESTR